MMQEYRSIGRNTPQITGVNKLKGASVYCADLDLDQSLILRCLRSGRHHALIRRIILDKALQIDGVVGIFTAGDIPGKNLLGIINKDQPLLAENKVRSASDPVALVAARDEIAASKALQAIEVEYEDLEPVFDPEKALQEKAPAVHEKGNLLLRKIIRKGDIEKGFAQSRHIAENFYQTPRLEHCFLEPDSGLGFVDSDGVLVIYASTQNPHYDHQELVSLLNVEDDRIRIIQAATGGGFGSKLDLNVQGFIALALFHLQKPVRYVYSREESFLATAKRHPLSISMKTGVDESGRIRALQARIVCDTGAYASYGVAVATRAAVHATGPYQVENVEIQSLCVYTNNPFSGAMRGFGAPQIAVAHESQMDILARELDMDPLEFRLMNSLSKGSVTATGQKLQESLGYSDCLEAVLPHYLEAQQNWLQKSSSPYKKRGIGLAGMWYGIGNTGVQNPSTAQVEIDLQGNVTLYTGCADIGQGSTTVLAQIAAESLGLEPQQLKLVVADTKLTTSAGATSASRQTYISGSAVKDAAGKLADVLLTEAVNKLKSSKASLVFDSGYVYDSDNYQKKVSLSWLANHAYKKGIPLRWQGYFDPETAALDPESGQGVPYATYAFACQVALVIVDTLTGEAEVEKVIAAHDVGRAINPENVKGQICGGVAMGTGFALMEEFVPGQCESFKDYHIPTCADMPVVVPIIVESPEPSGPYGAKGVGEPALIPTAPAILNGLAHALGHRIFHLPANLERVLEASVRSGNFPFKEVDYGRSSA